MAILAEYIWIDGTEPTALLRSKTKIMPGNGKHDAKDFPVWAFDGSSTNQAPGADSDRILNPVCAVPDPVRGENAYLVLCEVQEPNGAAHATNTRARLRRLLEDGGAAEKFWFAFEQEYTLFKGSSPLGFPAERRYPAAQGPYYCGVGADDVYGRGLVEDHVKACLDAGIFLTGINAEVMPGQWEFQCGGPEADPLKASDHLWLARWLLNRVGEDYGISVTLDPKPVPGDWNGAGMHTNFSTQATRDNGGFEVIKKIAASFEQHHDKHLAHYGFGNEARLTGAHETCSYKEFRWGVADRTASIRIPRMVEEQGKGYLEDRRPAANSDPYAVCEVIIRSTIGKW